VEHWVDGVPLHVGRYISDAEGQKVAVFDTVTGDFDRYIHDSVGRTENSTGRTTGLDHASTTTYDDAGNWISLGMDTDAALWPAAACPGAYEVDSLRNRYDASPCESFEYDAAGSLREVTALTGEGRERSLRYDFRNQLVQVSEPDIGGTRVTDFTYDPLGRLTAEVQRFVPATGAPTLLGQQAWVWFDERVVEQRKGPHTYSFVYPDGHDARPLQRRDEESGAQLFLFEDDVASVILAVEHDGQTRHERVHYSDYGVPYFVDQAGNGATTSQFDNDRLFGGLIHLPDHGYYYARRRMLDPRLGRFLTVDPVGRWTDESALGNPYTYAGNQPETSVDMEGTWKTPNFESGFTTAQRNTILQENMGRVEGRAWSLRHQMNWVMNTKGNTRKRYAEARPVYLFFSSYSWGHAGLIRDNARYIHQRASTDVVKFRNYVTGRCSIALNAFGQPTGPFAWTNLWRWAPIRICTNFWVGQNAAIATTPDPFGWWRPNRPGTILHEMAHNAGHTVGDKRTGSDPQAARIRTDNTSRWPAKGSNQGRYNADTYRMSGLYCSFGLGEVRC
jgi:RHS repeat-associated protein